MECEKCEKCGQDHNVQFWLIANVLLNGKTEIDTVWGKKRACGLTTMMEQASKTADFIEAKGQDKGALNASLMKEITKLKAENAALLARLDIATQAVRDAPLVVLRPAPRLLDNYATENGWRMVREYSGKTPNGNPINGQWVLRDQMGNFVDWDQYRADLAERNHMRISHEDEDRLKDQLIIENLTQALQDIIDECPKPKLPYGIRVNEIAREAIEKAKKAVKEQ